MTNRQIDITVCTPTIRIEGLTSVRDSLVRQTFQNFEWLIEHTFPSHGNDLNAAYNRMIKRAKGTLIVSLQDYITIADDGLERFWDAHLEAPTMFLTAPVVKAGRPDWRTATSKCDWMEWEIDWAAAPRAALVDIGGFDEELDKHSWTFDNVNVGLRAHLKNYNFACLPHNVAHAEDHDSFLEHPFRKLRNPDYHNQRLDEIRMNPDIVDYL